ncbi:MAG TPA: hypothetical protein VHM25_00050 [Polyangiaceae bacterium]|jgi:hypothetical protein|nr:hypothetical protein [Polyangiaceae bacterium]
MRTGTPLALMLCALSGGMKQAHADESSSTKAAISSEIPSEATSEYLPSVDGDLTSWDDSVPERRHFDRRLLQVGAHYGSFSEAQLLGIFAEANVWDRLALGGAAGLSFWGPEGSAYARFRAIVWGGEGQNWLNAITLRAEYTVLRQSGDILDLCDRDCGLRYLSRTAQVAGLSAGFEHQLRSGFTFRYDVGFGRVLSSTPWSCQLGGLPAPCTGEPPSDRLLVTLFAVGHSL